MSKEILFKCVCVCVCVWGGGGGKGYFPITVNIFPVPKILTYFFDITSLSDICENISDDVHEMKQTSIFLLKKKRNILFIFQLTEYPCNITNGILFWQRVKPAVIVPMYDMLKSKSYDIYLGQN